MLDYFRYFKKYFDAVCDIGNTIFHFIKKNLIMR